MKHPLAEPFIQLESSLQPLFCSIHILKLALVAGEQEVEDPFPLQHGFGFDEEGLGFRGSR